MEKLVSTYLDGDVPKEMYLKRKDTLMRVLAALKEQKKDFERGRKNWVEPLREWILDMKKATQLQSSDNFFEIRDYFKKIGTNSQLRNKSISVSFCPPTEFALNSKTILTPVEPRQTIARERADNFSDEVSVCDVLLSFARTYFEQNES